MPGPPGDARTWGLYEIENGDIFILFIFVIRGKSN